MMYNDHQAQLLSLFSDQQDSLIYLKGGSVLKRYQTDFEYPFRQESNFLYLTGIDEPDMAAFFDANQGGYTLVIPRRDTGYAVWMGYVHSPAEYQKRYGPDTVIYDDEVAAYLKKRNPKALHCLPITENDALDFGFPVDTGHVQDALAFCRSIKSDDELSCLRTASDAASRAHNDAMRAIRPGACEYEIRGVFESATTTAGMLHPPYNGIFASGPGSAILHYTGWQRQAKDGELFLIDAGAEYRGYAADITRTMPVNGRFSSIQADLYDVVLAALDEAIAAIKPGVKMESLHLLAARIITEGLRDTGLITGETDALMDAHIFALFFPHGLGHFLGLDTHDVGGYPKGTNVIDRPGLRFLRARRTLEERMVLTIEPGIYVIPALLGPAFNNPETAPFLKKDAIEPLFNFGGIRIEDNLVVVEGGSENMTSVPRSRNDIEACMS